MRRHLVDKVSVSSLCDEHQLHPAFSWSWLKQLFENEATALGPTPRTDKLVEVREHGIAFPEAILKKKDEVQAESLGDLSCRWVPHDTRDQVIDFVRRRNEATEIAVCTFVLWLGVASSKFYDWRARYGKVNQHNCRILRDSGCWTSRGGILVWDDRYPLEGYRG